MAVSLARAQETSALINKALDEPVKLQIKGNLPDAIDKITSDTGVRLREDPVIWDLLPWGRDTQIQATIENVSLRDALRALTRTLGLTLVTRDEYVEIQPMPALRRLGQRATRDDLKALDFLAKQPAGLETERTTVRQLLDAVDTKLAADKDLNLAIENRTIDSVPQDQVVFVPRNATLADALESLAKDTKATWYPWGKSIVVVTKEDRTRRLLGKPLTIRTGDRGMDVLQVLLEVAKRTGVTLEFQPGAIQALPAEARLIRGADGKAPVLENVEGLQILEAVAGATGLNYTIHDDKVYISSAAAGGAAGSRDPSIGLIQLDNGIQVLVPSSQVPADLREYLRYKTQRELAKVRKMMEEEGYKPSTNGGASTTQPATKASPDM